MFNQTAFSQKAKVLKRLVHEGKVLLKTQESFNAALKIRSVPKDAGGNRTHLGAGMRRHEDANRRPSQSCELDGNVAESDAE